MENLYINNNNNASNEPIAPVKIYNTNDETTTYEFESIFNERHRNLDILSEITSLNLIDPIVIEPSPSSTDDTTADIKLTESFILSSNCNLNNNSFSKNANSVNSNNKNPVTNKTVLGLNTQVQIH